MLRLHYMKTYNQVFGINPTLMLVNNFIMNVSCQNTFCFLVVTADGFITQASSGWVQYVNITIVILEVIALGFMLEEMNRPGELEKDDSAAVQFVVSGIAEIIK